MTTTKTEKYHVEGKVAVKIVSLGNNAGGLSGDKKESGGGGGADEKSPPVKVKAEGKVECKKRKSSSGANDRRKKSSNGGGGKRKSSSSEKSSSRSGRKKRSTKTEDRGVGTPSSTAGAETIGKGSKIAIVGVGAVGMACAYSILIRGVCNELVMVDCMADKVKGEMLDLQHGSLFAKPCVINASSDYAVIANSTIVVVTAGARQKVGESRLELVNRNVDIFKGIISNIVKYAPNCLILIVSNPVDVMTYVTWKLSGFDRSRVIGSGTNLDTARFRFLLSEKLKISPKNCHGWIIGEHGDASVALWSCANVAGIPLHVMKRGKDFECDELHQQVIKSAYEVIKLKGYTNWAIGLSVSDICHNILRNSMAVLPLSVSAKGLHLIKEDVYLSLPCIVGSSGIVDVIEQRLDNKELEKLQNSANTLFDLQEKLHL